MDTNKLLSSPAYLMFVEELDKHLSTAKAVLAALKPNTPLASADRTKLSTAFHTIRGGAGFFALVELASKAKDLEEMLQEAPGTDDTEDVRALVRDLDRVASCLPR